MMNREAIEELLRMHLSQQAARRDTQAVEPTAAQLVEGQAEASSAFDEHFVPGNQSVQGHQLQAVTAEGTAAPQTIFDVASTDVKHDFLAPGDRLETGGRQWPAVGSARPSDLSLWQLPGPEWNLSQNHQLRPPQVTFRTTTNPDSHPAAKLPAETNNALLEYSSTGRREEQLMYQLRGLLHDFTSVASSNVGNALDDKRATLTLLLTALLAVVVNMQRHPQPAQSVFDNVMHQAWQILALLQGHISDLNQGSFTGLSGSTTVPVPPYTAIVPVPAPSPDAAALAAPSQPWSGDMEHSTAAASTAKHPVLISTGPGQLKPPPPDGPSSEKVGATKTRNSCPEPFAQKLYRLLQESEAAGKSHIVSWTDSGLAFVISDSKAFMRDVAPRYFHHKKIASLKRQLSHYMFEIVYTGPDTRGFRHPHFIKGRFDLLNRVRREK